MKPDPAILAEVRASNLPRLMAIAEHVHTILNPQVKGEEAVKKLTQSDLDIAASAAEDMAVDLRIMAENIRKNLGWDDGVETPASVAAKFASLSRSAADLTSAILTRMAFEEDRKELEQRLQERSK